VFHRVLDPDLLTYAVRPTIRASERATAMPTLGALPRRVEESPMLTRFAQETHRSGMPVTEILYREANKP